MTHFSALFIRFRLDEMAKHRGHLNQMQNAHKPRSNFLGSATKSSRGPWEIQVMDGTYPRSKPEPTTREKAPKFTQKNN